MKVSASIEFVMQLAGQEAIAGEYEKITPDHLMLGILKFSELPVEDVDKIALGANAARGLAAEVEAVREELTDRSVDSTKARRRLRSVLGKGGSPYEGGRMHRSDESRAIFDAAGMLADDAGSEDFAAIHLLQAMLASPTEAMTKVLGDAVGEKAPKPSDTPKLAEHGRDLVAMAAEGELDPDEGREAERKALIQALADKKRGSVLLVTYDDAAAMAMVEGVAEAIAEGDRPNELKGMRIVDITAAKPKGKAAAEALEKLDKLLAEAASAKEVILFVPAIEAAPKGKKTANVWMDRVKSALKQGTVRCICQVAPSVYRDQMAEDRSWERLAHVLWIREEQKDDVPLGVVATMFTDKAQKIIDVAKDFAFSSGSSELTLSAVLTAMGGDAEAGVLLAECAGLTPEKLRAACPESPEPVSCPGKLPLAESTRNVLTSAKELAEEVPDRFHPGLVDLRHLACGLALSREACTILKTTPMAREDALAALATWYEQEAQAPALEELMERLRGMRADLLTRVFGQDHAIHAFIEGLFNAEVVATADTTRKAPRSVFVFAGPPGVGKTYLAELGASYLDRPFKRFDMSAYSGHQQGESLVGMHKSYKGAHPGILTEFVEKNPTALLLFDEIEKSHTKTIQLFLQILDAGRLEDKFHERDVSFRDTTIIFTTNVGRKLYDAPNASGVHSANARFHRKTILDALEHEKDPQTREPFFPAAICSRLATGYPVLFNHLGINELERVAHSTLARTSGLLERQYYKRVGFDDLLPLCLVLQEGANVDARTLRSQAEVFLKTELFKFCQLFKTDRLEDVFEQVNRIHIGLDGGLEDLGQEVRPLFEPQDRPRIMLIADSDLTALYQEYVTEVDWLTASTAEDALEILANEDVDFALLDIWLGRSVETASMTIQQFDHVPMAARSLDQGQELLRKIRDRLPNMPVYLLSLAGSEEGADDEGSVDEELFLACVRAGGARGMVVSSFIDGMVKGWEQQRDRLSASLVETSRRLYREKAAAKMGQERKVLGFDTVPNIDRTKREITIRLRNLRLTRAIASSDAGEVLEDVERPRTRFDDVIGATAAKEELQFFIDFLKNPKRFAALGLKPPKGVLLHGPPGTGKTMMARAMAGESNVAFIPATASSFVTMWQGSGPQNVRDLFARARRYAPAIIFIDEIDAIGKVRTGGAGNQSTENTLNALLTELDGFTSPSADRPVFVLAATNFKVESEDQTSPERSSRTLDPALVRRFSRAILVDFPERSARLEYLSKRLKDRPACTVTDEIINLIAERSPGMSIANLELIIETAARNAAKADSGLTDELLEEAFETVRFGESRIADPEAVRRTARHEAGHTIMYWLSGWWAAYVTIVSRGQHGGYMAPCSDEAEARSSQTRAQMLARIRMTLGGRGAELVYYGPEAGVSSGPSSDLEHASHIARMMVSHLGMDDDFGLLVSPQGNTEKVDAAAGTILKREMGNTVKLLEEHRSHLDALSEALIEKERLTADDLQKILPPIPEPAAQR